MKFKGGLCNNITYRRPHANMQNHNLEKTALTGFPAPWKMEFDWYLRLERTLTDNEGVEKIVAKCILTKNKLETEFIKTRKDPGWTFWRGADVDI